VIDEVTIDIGESFKPMSNAIPTFSMHSSSVYCYEFVSTLPITGHFLGIVECRVSWNWLEELRLNDDSPQGTSHICGYLDFVECLMVVFAARRNARISSTVLAMAIPSFCLSVRLSVCHMPVLCQNDGT